MRPSRSHLIGTLLALTIGGNAQAQDAGQLNVICSVQAESLRVFRPCPLTTPKRTRSSLQILAIAPAMAVVCA